MNRLETLQKMRELLSDPSRWCQGFSALDGEGRFVPLHMETACRWCLLGAAGKVTGCLSFIYPGSVIELLDVMAQERGYPRADYFNDNNDHAAVLAFLDEAILRVKQMEV